MAVHPVKRVFHLRTDDRADLQRMARVITGQSVGLVLSGGGARAYAHIGAIKAMRDAGVPFDFVGGVSMGAIVGAGLALGWDEDEMDDRIRKAFVDTSPLDDIALPLIAMTRGRKVEDRLAEHFGEARDPGPVAAVLLRLRRPHRGRLPGAPHRPAARGAAGLGLAARRAAAGDRRRPRAGRRRGDDQLPGRPDAGRAPRGGGRGATSRWRPASPPHDIQTPPLLRWLLSGAWRRGPPIVSVLMRSATIRSRAEMLLARQNADIVIAPEMEGIEIRNWKAYDPAVDAGYVAAVQALDALDRPLTQLRAQRRREAEIVDAEFIDAR